jgi:multidrug efflux pump subunit AcrA (membrane-fusion protein)
MILKYGLPLAAMVMLAWAVFHVVQTYPAQPTAQPPLQPAHSPFATTLAATGVIEPNTGNIAVAAPTPGVVAEVFVKAGQLVSAEMPLFRLDDRSLQAELAVREAHLATARAQLARLEQMPRSDEVTASAARVAEARAHVAMQQARLERGQSLFKEKLASPQEVETLKQSLAAAKEKLDQAHAEDRLLRGGAWEADKAIAQATVVEATTLVGQAKTELGRLIVRAPVQATVLQVNIRAGEAAVGRPELPPIVLGRIRPLHLRVDVPEEQLASFRPTAPARAVPRGYSPSTMFPLCFVRVEPIVVPKRVLTGDSSERSDTRVLQVIFEFDPGKTELYVGQQMDVFIAAAPDGDESVKP